MNRRLLLFALAALLGAMAIDYAIVPALASDLTTAFLLTQPRAMAMAVILCGLLRSRYETLVFAWICAMIGGSLAGPGFVGATIISFTMAGLIAQAMGHIFHHEPLSLRWGMLFGLAILEGTLNSALHHWVEPRMAIEVAWPAHLIVSFFGIGIYAVAAPRIRFLPRAGLPIGRKKRTSQ